MSNMAYLRNLIVHWKNRDVEADSVQGASTLVPDRHCELHMSRGGTYILHGWHVGHFHMVNSMLGSKWRQT